MSAMTKEERDALTDFSKKWGPLLGNNASHSSITFQGGAGVWISATCCLLMLVILIVGAAAYLEVRQEQRETAARMQTMFMLIPDLRKMVEDELSRKRNQ